MNWLTLREAADVIGLSYGHTKKLAAAGQLPATKKSGIWLVKESDATKFARLPRRKPGRPKGNARS